MEEFSFQLKKPVKYSHNGEDSEATFIILKEPSIKQLDYVTVFKKAFYQAAGKIESSSTEISGEDPKQVTGDQIMALLYQNSPDMKQLFNVAKKLFYSINIARVDGVVEFSDAIYQTMSIEDFERMIGEYLVNFILASALNPET